MGGLHRNTFINSPRLLDATLRLKADPRLRFAGQITGVEGYVESAAIGLLAGRFAAAERAARRSRRRRRPRRWARCSATSPAAPTRRRFQPMNVNFGLFPPLPACSLTRANRGEKKPLFIARARARLGWWLGEAAAAE